MSFSWGILIALIYVAIQVFSYLAKESAKRKERERKMEEAERRRMATARIEPPTPDISGSIQGEFRSAMTPDAQRLQTVRMERSVDDLAERRKQQIEQLRIRAGLKAGSGTKPPPSKPASQGPTPQTRTSRVRATPATIEMGRPATAQQRTREMEREQQLRVQRQTREVQQRDAIARAQRASEIEREAKQQQQLAREAQIRRDSNEPAAPRPTAINSQAKPSRIRLRLRDQSSLRELIVLKEIIDPPVGLRQS